jgi:hypothetical protein
MKELAYSVSCLGLLLALGCGISTSTDPKKIAGDLLTKEKDELLGKLDKMLPEAKKLEEGLEAKVADTKGEAKTVLEKLLTRLQDLRKAVADKVEELKKSGAEGLKDKLLALTKDSEALSKVMEQASGALKKKGKEE